MATTALQATQGAGTPIGFRDIGGGTYSQRVDMSPWEATQYTGAVRLAVGTSVVGTTGNAGTFSIPTSGGVPATHLYLSVETPSGTGGIRFWNTGDTPTAGTAGAGHELASGAGPLELDNIGLLKMVTSDASVLGTVQLSFHRYP